MKKILSLLFVALLVFTLAACKEEVDETAPVIYGAVDVSIDEGEDFDLLLTVTGLDEVDGKVDVTVSVTDTTDLDVGEHDVVYTAEDEAGNEVTKTITLVVNDMDSPVITGMRNIEMRLGTDLDLLDGVTATDEVDGTTTVAVDIADTTALALGEYTVTYTSTDAEGNTKTELVNLTVYQFSGKLIVGTTDFTGQFLTGFGNSSYDNDIRLLMGGYETVSFTKEGELVINTTVVVNDPISTRSEDADDNVTMTFEIEDDLMFANGDPVTASDYVFSAKMYSSQAYVHAGASSTAGIEIVGYDEWHDGCYYITDTTDCDPDHDYEATPLDFSGIQEVSEFVFTIEINAEEFPYFYELALFGMSPINEKMFLQDGAYELVADEMVDPDNVVVEDRDFTVGSEAAGDYIKEFVSNPVNGLFAGPYYFVEYLPGQSVKLQANENFIGDYRGHQPGVAQLVIKVIPSTTDMESLLAGEIELFTGLVEGDKINQGIAADGIARSHYPRNGFGAIFFHIDHYGPIGDKYVRQAIAYMLDREAFVDAFTGGYAEIVNGPYGLSQWMVQENQTWLDETLTNYTLDYALANDALDMTEWKFEDDGTTAFDADLADADYQRYNAAGEVLEVTWMGMADTDFQELLKPELLRGALEVGMELIANTGDWPTLLGTYYYADGGSCSDEDIVSPRLCEDASETWTDNAERGDDAMFNLATGFADLYDPYWSYHSDFYNQWMNSSQIDSALVDQYVIALRQAETKEDFVEQWKLFQVWMNENLPVLPLYSNDYHDFYATKLKGFDTTSIWDWTKAIVDCYIEE